VFGRENHIADCAAHIILTQVGEYDVLPEFGSRPDSIIHDPNNEYSRMEYEVWLRLALARWEKRVRVDGPQHFQWTDQSNESMDRGEAIYRINPEVMRSQVPGNLVAPFTNARNARSQEYPMGTPDSEGHDWTSRYYGMQAYQYGTDRMLRLRQVGPISTASDDGFYETQRNDNWWRVSWALYRDVRFWWVIADFYVNDMAESGGSSDALDVTDDLPPGTLLRAPSKARLLTEFVS
jgi:phage baseplate assembly protein W